jgi:hypothetical protein
MNERTEDLERDEREAHLSELMRAASGDPSATAQLADMPPGLEGMILVTSIGSHESPCALISDRLSPVGAEAAVLHEAGHWLEGHEEWGSEAWRAYQAARDADVADGTRTRGPFEHAADRRGIERLTDAAVRAVLASPPDDVRADLLADARQYGPFEL